NAWAGSLYMQHSLSSPTLVASGDHFDSLVSDGAYLAHLLDSEIQWRGSLGEELILEIKNFSAELFLILTEDGLHLYSGEDNSLMKVFSHPSLTSFDIIANGTKIGLGTRDGYIELDAKSYAQ